MSEEWRTIPGFSDYAVSSEGRVKRSAPDRYGRNCGMILKPVARPDGYSQVTLHRDARQQVRLIHRIVCEAFHAPSPGDSYHAAHSDGNRANNRANNLRWATASDNNADKIWHGTIRSGADHHARLKPDCMPRGTKHGNAKLTDTAIQSIRRDARRQRDIAAEYGVSQSLISMIKNGHIWAHLSKGDVS